MLYATVGWTYLAPNGGWGVSGRNGYKSENLLSNDNWQKVNGDWVEQVTKDGGFVLIRRGKNNYGQPNRGFTAENMPEALVNDLSANDEQGNWIEKVRIGYNGEWFLMAHDLGGRSFWTWNSASIASSETFASPGGNYHQDKSGRIRDVAFLPNRGVVIVSDRNTLYAENVPDEPLNVLKMLRDNNYEISQITFGPEDSWIIRANGTW